MSCDVTAHANYGTWSIDFKKFMGFVSICTKSIKLRYICYKNGLKMFLFIRIIEEKYTKSVKENICFNLNVMLFIFSGLSYFLKWLIG